LEEIGEVLKIAKKQIGQQLMPLRAAPIEPRLESSTPQNVG
jgi:hypothetical protein